MEDDMDTYFHETSERLNGECVTGNDEKSSDSKDELSDVKEDDSRFAHEKLKCEDEYQNEENEENEDELNSYFRENIPILRTAIDFTRLDISFLHKYIAYFHTDLEVKELMQYSQRELSDDVSRSFSALEIDPFEALKDFLRLGRSPDKRRRCVDYSVSRPGSIIDETPLSPSFSDDYEEALESGETK